MNEDKEPFFKFPNEAAAALMRTNLSSYQSRILWAIWRKTYGWNKKEDWISHSQLVEMTRIRKQHISRTITELKDRNIVTKAGNKIAFNQDFTQWRELPKKVTKPNKVTRVTHSGKKVTSSGDHKRHYTKDTITKDKKKSSPDPRVRELFSFYSQEYEKTFQKKPILEYGRDGKVVKALLAAYSMDDLKTHIPGYLACDDSFLRKWGFDIQRFKDYLKGVSVGAYQPKESRYL